MAEWIKNKVVNSILKITSKKEKLCRIFLNTGTNNVKKTVIYVITKKTFQKILEPLKSNNSYQKKGKIHNGLLNGVSVSVIKGEIGAPNAAIIMEICHLLDVKRIFRVDLCGSLMNEIEIGDVFIPECAFSGEGTTSCYLDANPNLKKTQLDNISTNNEIITIKSNFSRFEELQSLQCPNSSLKGSRIKIGNIWTTDAIFCETEERINYWKKCNAHAVDMETSIMYFLGNIFGIETVAILGVSDQPNTEYDLINGSKLHPKIQQSFSMPALVLEKILQMIGLF